MRSLRAIVVAASLAAAITMAPARADDTSSGGGGTFTIQFEDVELPVFIKFIGKATGRNFVFSEKVAGTVTVVSPTPVTASEAFAVFQSVLAVRNLTMIDDGVVTRIVPLKDARTSGVGLMDQTAGTSGFATRLLPLTHVDARDVTAALEPLVSRDGSLVAYPQTNTLIATDSIGNLKRMADVVRALDIASHEEAVEVIALQHADAKTLALQIIEILGDGGLSRSREKGQADKPPFKLVSDERTNSIVVVGSAADRRKVAELARNLDTPLTAGDQRIHVYYAKHADAQSLVTTINSMITGRRRGAPAAARGGQAGAAGPRSIGLSDDVTVTADVATNSVIINAGQQDYRAIMNLVESLDIERPQVFVEAIIAEVTLDRSEALGFEFQLGGEGSNGAGLARSNFGALSGLASAAGAASTFGMSGLILAATSNKTIRLPDGTEVPAQTALFSALAADQDIEVLSAPTLLTLDNEEARIIVGENVPFITGQAADIQNVDSVFTQVERRDVGIKLTITPQVSEGDIVTLDVQEEVSAIVPASVQTEIVTEIGPTYTIRSAETMVSVRDGRTAVIGGLMSNSLATRISKVPFLGDIPYLGRLFRSEAGRDEKVNLIVVLTPHIIRNADDLGRLSEQEGKRYRGRVDEMPAFMGERTTPEVIPGADPEVPTPGADSGIDTIRTEVLEEPN